VEVDPPDRYRAGEGDDQRRDAQWRDRLRGERRAGGHHRLPQRDQEEQPEPLDEVLADHLVVAGRGTTPARHGVTGIGSDSLDGDGAAPQQQTRGRIGHGTPDPQCGCAAPPPLTNSHPRYSKAPGIEVVRKTLQNMTASSIPRTGSRSMSSMLTTQTV